MSSAAVPPPDRSPPQPTMNATPNPDDAVYTKTEKAHAELRRREFGMNPRRRQLLILVDGRRPRGEIAKLMPEVPVAEWLAELDRDGFVTRVPGPGEPPPPANGWEPLPAVRARVSRALLDTVGATGSDMANRVSRCVSVDELRELLPAAVSVVEAIGGQPATRSFLQRAGRI